MISKHKIERPDSFGSKEYFHRDQHCENPNPDLLAKHGAALKVKVVYLIWTKSSKYADYG